MLLILVQMSYIVNE